MIPHFILGVIFGLGISALLAVLVEYLHGTTDSRISRKIEQIRRSANVRQGKLRRFGVLDR